MKKDIFSKEPAFMLPTLHWAGWLLVAALLASLIGGVIFMLRPQMDERIYARYRNIPKATFLENQEARFQLLQEASSAFNAKNYSKALRLFEQDSSVEFHYEKQLFSGICLLELNRAEAVISSFQKAKEQHLPSYINKEITWYLALAYLRNHQRDLCINTLLEIVDEPRKSESQNVLKHLL